MIYLVVAFIRGCMESENELCLLLCSPLHPTPRCATVDQCGYITTLSARRYGNDVIASGLIDDLHDISALIIMIIIGMPHHGVHGAVMGCTLVLLL